MPFAVSMIWRELTNHLTDCYFCMVPPIHKGITKKKKWTVEYPNLPSAICPMSQCVGLPISEPPDSSSLDCDEEEENTPEETPQSSTSKDPKFFLNVTSAEPHKITQNELSDLIRDLQLLKNKAELLSSRLQQCNLLDGTVKVTAFRSCHKDFEQFFVTQGKLGACKNVQGLMAAINIRYNLEEWRLFKDSPMHSLKAVLLHKGNIVPSTPVAYAVHKKGNK
jgi:hypothetical protein